MDRVLTPLCELAKKYATDKGGWHLLAGDTCHNYTPTYHQWFSGRENEVQRVLEIGVNYGPSLRMWEEYFPNAEIIGLDSNTACLFNAGRIKCFAADQGSQQSLLGALMEAGTRPFDFIVDDGSHEFAHQLVSLKTLLPYLTARGIYVIEDIAYDCQPELFFPHIPDGFVATPWVTGIGLGKAHCWDACDKCHGSKPECLIAIERK